MANPRPPSSDFWLELGRGVAKTSGGTAPVVEFKGYIRQGGAGACWLQVFDKRVDASATDEIDIHLPIPNSDATEKTDMRFRADTDQNSTETRVRLIGALIRQT